jgi:hypothetical protein
VRGLSSEFTKKYPVYKDLEPFYEYKSSHIIDIHADILKLVNFLYTHYSGKENTINAYNQNTKVGMSINSFMQTLEYENTLLREQIGLYVSYITFFHSSHTGYLTKLSLKIQGFQKEIEEEIMVNHRGSIANEGVSVGGASDVLKDVQDLTNSEIGELLMLTEDEPTEIEKLLRDSEAALESGSTVIQEFENAVDKEDPPRVDLVPDAEWVDRPEVEDTIPAEISENTNDSSEN